jgi:hypothetical protein
MPAMNRIPAIAVALLVSAGCSGERIVNTGEPPVQAETSTRVSPPAAPADNAHLVNAFDYAAHVDDRAVYYFTTPSGKWRCAIVTRDKAGCQAASSWQSGLNIPGEPTAVPDPSGEDTTPNAIVIDREGDPQFVALQAPEFWLDTGSATVLQFNRILAAAGFQCNVQEIGVSCMSEVSGKGFTFSAEEGMSPQYTSVPVDAP